MATSINAAEPKRPPKRSVSEPRSLGSDIVARKVTRESLAVRTRHLARIITRLYDEQLRPLELTADRFEILAVAISRAPVSTGELAGLLHLDAQGVGRTIESMAASGWLAWVEGPGGSTGAITATIEGRRLLEEAMPAWKRAQAAAADLLGPTGTRAITSQGVYTAIW